MFTIDQIIEDYGKSLGRVASAHEADRALQEDLLQEILIAIHRALPALQEKERLAPYIFRIAHNRAATHVARQVRQKQVDGEAGLAQEESEHPEVEIISSERVTRLERAVRRLPLPYRMVMTLLLEEMTYAEIAETLEISPSNVGVRVNRAKAKLKELLDEQ